MPSRLDMALAGRQAAADALLGRDADADQMGLEDYESGLVDVLTNLMHFAYRYDLNFNKHLARADLHFEVERKFDWEEETS